MLVLCQKAAQHDEVLQDMFLKQSQTSLRNIMPEQLIQWSYVTLKLDGIASFLIKGSKQGARERPRVHRIQDVGIWWYSAWQICWETFVSELYTCNLLMQFTTDDVQTYPYV